MLVPYEASQTYDEILVGTGEATRRFHMPSG